MILRIDKFKAGFFFWGSRKREFFFIKFRFFFDVWEVGILLEFLVRSVGRVKREVALNLRLENVDFVRD